MNNIHLKIEQLSSDNLTELTHLTLELWDDCVFEEEYAFYKSLIDKESDVCFLAKSENIFIGFIHVSARHDYVEGAENMPLAYIEGIYVKPDYQNRGVAKALITEAENWAKQKGFKQIASDTEVTNTSSIHFHKKIGFSEVTRIVCFIKNI
ncbi:MAG: GNAT family N-acetyltransferase [Raineya sp.]|jgi:aminoglycoside 6'-N-acetyltransferase I|nr:GNAT family N-acetyltransferase [Raineya sp.]